MSNVCLSTCEIRTAHSLVSFAQVLDLPQGSELRIKKKYYHHTTWSYEIVHTVVHLRIKDLIPRSNRESLPTITLQYFKNNFAFCVASQKSLIVISVQQIRSSIHARLVSLMAQILSCFWRLSTAECYWSPHKWHLKRKRNPCEVSAVFASLRDWLRKLSHVHSLRPIRVKELTCRPIRSKPSRDFSRTCYRLHVFALKSDWLTI